MGIAVAGCKGRMADQLEFPGFARVDRALRTGSRGYRSDDGSSAMAWRPSMRGMQQDQPPHMGPIDFGPPILVRIALGRVDGIDHDDCFASP